MQIAVNQKKLLFLFCFLVSVSFAEALSVGSPYSKKVAQVSLDTQKSLEESGAVTKGQAHATAGSANSAGSANATASIKKTEFAVPPQFKDDEYAIFLDESYKIFKTKKFEKLELTEACFAKSARPKCMAYEFAQIRPKKLEMKAPGLNNMSAIHCDEVGGRNLLALDNKNNQYNFCRFDDGSMVNSWSMHYKFFPAKTVQ